MRETQLSCTEITPCLSPSLSGFAKHLQQKLCRGAVCAPLTRPSAESPAAYPGSVAIPCTSLCWKTQDEEGISWLSAFFHQVNELIQLVQSAPADTKDGVGEGMTPFPEHWLKSIVEFQAMPTHAFGDYSMCPVWKLRHQENVGDQLVKGCHYYLKCS